MVGDPKLSRMCWKTSDLKVLYMVHIIVFVLFHHSKFCIWYFFEKIVTPALIQSLSLMLIGFMYLVFLAAF